ncbi:MAG: DUF5667 domain-containing protein [Dehalococcoidia bacterium]|jgi:hypothetical protein
MAIRIEEAFNDCFDRLTIGESLDSCLRRYPEYSAELDMMLRMAYDVKRRAYPIQPRPEFKYWSRVRLQGVQDYMSRHAVPQKSGSFSFRRNLAISMAGLLVLVIASSGTAAASNNALPDQPLYGVKMAVEQAQVSLATSDIDRAEIYAKLAEKRAQEIEALARQGKAEYLVSTSAKMDYQLEQAETYIGRFQAANTVSPAPTMEATTAAAPADETSGQPAQTDPRSATQVRPYAIPGTDKPQVPPAGTSATDTTDRPNWIGDGKTTVKQPVPASRALANVSKAKTALNSSTAKSLATLQDALDKAPESAKPAIIQAIERVKKANEWSQGNSNSGQNYKPPIIQPGPKYVPPTINRSTGTNINKNTDVNTNTDTDKNSPAGTIIYFNRNTDITNTDKTNTNTNTGTTTTTPGAVRPTTILTDTQKLAPSTSLTNTTSDEKSVLPTSK